MLDFQLRFHATLKTEFSRDKNLRNPIQRLASHLGKEARGLALRTLGDKLFSDKMINSVSTTASSSNPFILPPHRSPFGGPLWSSLPHCSTNLCCSPHHFRNSPLSSLKDNVAMEGVQCSAAVLRLWECNICLGCLSHMPWCGGSLGTYTWNKHTKWLLQHWSSGITLRSAAMWLRALASESALTLLSLL